MLSAGRIFLSSHLIYSLAARVLGTPQMLSQPVSSLFPCRPLPSGTCRTPGLSIPCLPCLFPPFTVPSKMVLARPDEREVCPYQCSLRLFTMVRFLQPPTGTPQLTLNCPKSAPARSRLSLSFFCFFVSFEVFASHSTPCKSACKQNVLKGAILK